MNWIKQTAKNRVWEYKQQKYQNSIQSNKDQRIYSCVCSKGDRSPMTTLEWQEEEEPHRPERTDEEEEQQLLLLDLRWSCWSRQSYRSLLSAQKSAEVAESSEIWLAGTARGGGAATEVDRNSKLREATMKMTVAKRMAFMVVMVEWERRRGREEEVGYSLLHPEWNLNLNWLFIVCGPDWMVDLPTCQ